MATDFAMKLIRLSDSNLLGFAGDVQTVQYFIPYIFRHLSRRRTDAVSISRWLPRFFRRTYRALACQYPIGQVEFMVASSIRGRPTIVHPGLIRTSLECMRVLGSPNWLALRCLKQLDSPLDEIAIPDSNLGMLYVMRSPDFTPLHCPPMSVMAIGSGQAAIEDLERHSPFIMCGRPDRAPERFLDALSTYSSAVETRPLAAFSSWGTPSMVGCTHCHSSNLGKMDSMLKSPGKDTDSCYGIAAQVSGVSPLSVTSSFRTAASANRI